MEGVRVRVKVVINLSTIAVLDSLILPTRVLTTDESDLFSDSMPANERDTEASIENDIVQLLWEDDQRTDTTMCLILLELKEIYTLSQVAVDGVVQGLGRLFNATVFKLHAGVMHHLSLDGIATDQLKETNAFFSNINSPFVDLRTDHLQQKYYQNNFGLVVSK